MIRAGTYDHKRTSGRLRLGLLVLALSAAFPGVWALGWPQSFFSNFPGFGLEWVSSHPPYNEHLVRDVGSFYVAFAVLLGLAALWGEGRTIRAALLAWLVFSIPHLVWHWQHVSEGGVVDKWGSVVALGAGVLLTLGLLWSTRRR